jgi:hypothetical protein
MRIVTPTRKHVSILLTFCIYFSNHVSFGWDHNLKTYYFHTCKFGMTSQSQNLILKTKENFKMRKHVMFFVQSMKETGFSIREAIFFKL